MSAAQRHRFAHRTLLTGLALATASCGPRVEPLPLDTEPPPPPVVAHAAPAAVLRPPSFSEEDLPEIAATAEPTPTATVPAAAGTTPWGATPSPTAEPKGPTLPSPLDTIRAGTPPNVAAATRLADAARVRMTAGDDAAALEQLERAIAIDPNNPYAYYFLAQLHFRTRSYDQAIAFADRAAALSSATASAEWTSRACILQGNAYEAAGRFADARQAYLRAVRATPGNLAALAGLARTGGSDPP
jgi:hypothetical protein